jgi:hypothetical protein
VQRAAFAIFVPITEPYRQQPMHRQEAMATIKTNLALNFSARGVFATSLSLPRNPALLLYQDRPTSPVA